MGELCCRPENPKKQNIYLVSVQGKIDSDVVEARVFNPKENSLMIKHINIFRKLSSSELKFININADIYLLIHSEKTHFLHINIEDDFIREIPFRDDIGKNPSLCNLNNGLILFIGGLNSENVFTFEWATNNFEFVGRMSTVRYGAYAIKYNQTVYICGGVNKENDNTLEVEYFNLNKHYEIKTVKFENSYLLRKINPLCFEVGFGEMFLVCGGYCLFDQTDTVCFVQADKLNAQVSNINMPKPITCFNPNTLNYKGFYYFFGEEEENEIYKFSEYHKSFTRIKKEDISFI